jgi:hypothetical protein
MTRTAKETPSETPALMMSRLPSPFTQTPTATEQFIKIPYSRQPSPLSPEQEAIQEANEAEAKQMMTASAMAGTAVGVAGAASAVAIVSSLFQKPPNLPTQQNGQQQNQDNQQQDDQTRKRRRLRRPKLDDSDEEDETRVKDTQSEEDESMPERSPSRENVTITPTEDGNHRSLLGIVKQGLKQDRKRDNNSQMRTLTYYIPSIPVIFNNSHSSKYTHIEYDSYTPFIDSNRYWTILSKSPITMDEITDFIMNPIRAPKNILAIYNHENATLYGECSTEEKARMQMRPMFSTYKSMNT